MEAYPALSIEVERHCPALIAEVFLICQINSLTNNTVDEIF
jgi:hypothetical protein